MFKVLIQTYDAWARTTRFIPVSCDLETYREALAWVHDFNDSIERYDALTNRPHSPVTLKIVEI